MKNKIIKQRGFTLIELLVVIAIIAVLSIVVVLTLNPAELLKQARDSNRVSDLSTLKSAISLYLADVSSPAIASTSAERCYQALNLAAGSTTCAWFGTVVANTIATGTTANLRKIDGNGWVPVNFNSISSGAPIGQLPIDPLGITNVNYFYSYVGSSTQLTFKMAAKLESNKYTTGTGDLIGTDGGTASDMYEQGTNLAL